jgi:hypothetical protein
MEDSPDLLRLLAIGQSEPLARFVRTLGRRKGLRISRTDAGAILSVDADRVEAVGPVIEAASVASGVELRLADLDAIIESAGRIEPVIDRLWSDWLAGRGVDAGA